MLLQYYRSFQQSRAVDSTPTFEDLSVDFNLTEHQRFLKYIKSSIALQRLAQVKLISYIAENIG